MHTKVGIVDNSWATVGSANLDGASLDYTQFVHPLQFADNRNHELNYIIFNHIDGQPATDAVNLLRRSLWGEHLGLSAAANDVSKTGPLSAVGPNADKWLQLWSTTATTNASSLVNDPSNPLPARILPYPPKPTSDPKKFLKGLSIGFDLLDFVNKVRSFSFKKGDWD